MEVIVQRKHRVDHLVRVTAKAPSPFQIQLKRGGRIQWRHVVDDEEVGACGVRVARHYQRLVIRHGSQCQCLAVLPDLKRQLLLHPLAFVIHSRHGTGFGDQQSLRQTAVGAE